MTLTLSRPALRSSSRVGWVTHRLLVSDLLVITWAVVGAQLVRFGPLTDGSSASTAAFRVDYPVVSLVVILLWLGFVKVYNSYDPRLLGHGPEEYRAIGRATFGLFAALAIVSYLLKLELARGYLLVALPFGLLGLLVSRWIWRRWLGMHRARGDFCSSMLLVGDRDHLEGITAALKQVPGAGFRVVGACCSDDDGPIGDVPVIGTESNAAAIAQRVGADVVACSGSRSLGSAGLRRLGWDLERTGIGLVLAPGMTQVAGPRILTRPVAGLPMLHVEAPVFSGPRLAMKSTLDVLGSLGMILLLSPIFLAIWALVRRDGGPAIYRQTRIGIDGRPFTMFKFRSMVVGADKITLEAPNEGAGPLFKLRSDPRITAVGRVLRRSSLDELPQLFNVLRGEMSLVGPRPPLAAEVARYEQDVHRRLLVKPGLTGLWQVSGRSDLPWEDAVRLDLYYVENWNLVEDLKILFRTGLAVLRKTGAY